MKKDVNYSIRKAKASPVRKSSRYNEDSEMTFVMVLGVVSGLMFSIGFFIGQQFVSM